MLASVQVTVTLTEINCGCCGGTYAINERYRQQKYEKGETWTCPYCNASWGYSGRGENERLKRELEGERTRKLAALDRANAAEAAALKAEKSKARLEKRIRAGTCPCCHRTFKQLTAHMKAKHPEHVNA